MFEQLMQVQCYVEFRSLDSQRCCGLARRVDHRITIDLAGRENVAKAFLHELIHLLHEDWEEEQVLYWETVLWLTLSHDDVELIYLKLFRDNAKRSAS